MSSTQLRIANRALRRVSQGEAALSAVDATSKGGRIIVDVWDDAMRGVLADHPWNFALHRGRLVGLAHRPPDWGFSRAYIKPDGNGVQPEWLRNWRRDDTREVEFQVVGAEIHADANGTPENALTSPDALDGSAWSDAGTGTVTANATAGPRGSSDADLVSDTDAAARYGRTQSIAITSSEKVHFGGIAFKANDAGRSALQLKLTGGTTPITAFAELTYATPSVAKGGAQAGQIVDYGFVDLGDSWAWTWLAVQDNGTGNNALSFEVYPTGLSDGAASDQASAYAVDAWCERIDPVRVEWCRPELDPAAWSAFFVEAATARLAWEIAPALTRKVTQQAQLWDEYRMFLGDAKGIDGQEGDGDAVFEDTWLNSRFVG